MPYSFPSAAVATTAPVEAAPVAPLSDKENVLGLLRSAIERRANLGLSPACLAPDTPGWGWVSGHYFATVAGVLRFGARIHELRHERGLDIQTHQEEVTREGGKKKKHSFYRLASDQTFAIMDNGYEEEKSTPVSEQTTEPLPTTQVEPPESVAVLLPVTNDNQGSLFGEEVVSPRGHRYDP